jgi:hypothetical protein
MATQQQQQPQDQTKGMQPLVMIPLGAAHWATVKPNDGASRARIPIGEFTWKIREVYSKPAEGKQTPHVMAVFEFEIVKAHNPEHEEFIGSSMLGYYAGSAQSPRFMHERMAQLIQAVGVKPGAQGISRKDLIGREFDATITWEISQPRINPTTGETRRFVNARLKGERKIGEPRPPRINPEAESRQAVAWLNANGEGDLSAGGGGGGGGGGAGDFGGAPSGGDEPPWEDTGPQGEATPEGGEVAGQEAGAETGGDAGGAGEMDDTVNQYRAIYQMGHPAAEQAKAALQQIGQDPEAAVQPDALPDDLRKLWDEYQIKAAQAKKTGKPSVLAGLTGTGNGQGGGQQRPRTGTRGTQPAGGKPAA